MAVLNDLVFRIADGFEVAIEAAGLAGDTNAAAMPDELVGKLNPFFFRNDAHEVLLYFFGIFVLREIEAAREANHVGIDHDAARDAIGGAQHYVARFSRHTWEREDFVHGFGDLAAEGFEQRFAGAHDGFGLVSEKSGGPNLLLQFAGVGVGEGLRIGIFLVERFGDLVYAYVGTLRRKNRRDQEL